MRRPLAGFTTVSACVLALTIASTAQASPYLVRSLANELAPTLPPDGGGTAPETQQPTTAPTETPPAETPPAETAPTEAPTETPAETTTETAPAEGPEAPAEGEAAGEEITLEDERAKSDEKADKKNYNRHGIGVRAGLTLIPTWVLSGFLASHTNALCRGDVGNFAEERGLTKTQGCNFFVGAEYIFRQSPVFDIVGSVGYQHAKAPDGYWLDEDEWNDGCVQHDENAGCDLGAADYTELDMGFVFIEADFIGRFPVVNTPDFKMQLGGGGGLGLGIIVGPGVYQTPIGRNSDGDPSGVNNTPTCSTIADLSDFERCTPRYWDDPDIDQDGDGMNVDPLDPPGGELSTGNEYASCSRDECRTSDLEKFGSRRKQEDIPPVIPVVNLILSIRFVVKDVVGINLQGGWNTGFYFGGGLQYFFGKKKGSAPPAQAAAVKAKPAVAG